jgi:predicted MFS family arabinose efflux permease
VWPAVGPSKPVVKVRLHSAGDASRLTALLLPQIFPIGAGAGIGTICATYLTGFVADRYSFQPILIGASIVPYVAALAVLALVRNTDATMRGTIRHI